MHLWVVGIARTGLISCGSFGALVIWWLLICFPHSTNIWILACPPVSFLPFSADIIEANRRRRMKYWVRIIFGTFIPRDVFRCRCMFFTALKFDKIKKINLLIANSTISEDEMDEMIERDQFSTSVSYVLIYFLNNCLLFFGKLSWI